MPAKTTAAIPTSPTYQEVWNLVRTIRYESDCTHPARVGLGDIVTRCLDNVSTPEDLTACHAILAAVRS